MNTADRGADRCDRTAYVLKGITYVPHYRNENVFVGPGYGKHNFTRYSGAELMLMGATPTTEHLWLRGTNGTVDSRNP
jgi:hypothetical protein